MSWNPVYGSLAWEIIRGFLTGRFQYYLKTFFASKPQYFSLLHFLESIKLISMVESISVNGSALLWTLDPLLL